MPRRLPPCKLAFPGLYDDAAAPEEEPQVVNAEEERRLEILNRLMKLVKDDYNRRRTIAGDIFFKKFTCDYVHLLFDAISSRFTGIDLTAIHSPNGAGGVFPDDPLDIDEIFRGKRNVMLQTFINECHGMLLEYHARRLAGDPVPLYSNAGAGEVGSTDHVGTGDKAAQAASTAAPGIGNHQQEDITAKIYSKAGGCEVSSKDQVAAGDQGEKISSPVVPENGNHQQEDITVEIYSNAHGNGVGSSDEIASGDQGEQAASPVVPEIGNRQQGDTTNKDSDSHAAAEASTPAPENANNQGDTTNEDSDSHVAAEASTPASENAEDS